MVLLSGMYRFKDLYKIGRYIWCLHFLGCCILLDGDNVVRLAFGGDNMQFSNGVIKWNVSF
jgi:hypothetical protein